MSRSSAELHRGWVARVLGSPLWIASLGILALNDHVLKGSGLLPGALTGKLSDVAGMFVAPPLLALLLRVKTQRGMALAHAAVGLGFTALELSSVLSARLDGVYQVFGARWVSTSDWTDLLVLPLLAISYVLAVRPAEPRRVGLPSARRAREMMLAGAGVLACVATSAVDDDGGVTPDPTDCTDCDLDGFFPPDDCNDFDFRVNPDLGNCPGSTANEACDNGVDDNNDSLADCEDPQCALACADSVTACQNPVAVITQSGLLAGSTLQGSWVVEGTCGGADAPENIFQIAPVSSAVVTVTPPPGHVVYARYDCQFAHEELACIAGVDPDDEEEPEPLVVSVPAGQVLTLVVDAIEALDAGPYSVPIDIAPVGCGDGIIDFSSEDCDDGNFVDNDGCSASCTVELDVVCEQLPSLTLGPVDTTFAGATYAFVSSCSGVSNGPDIGFRYVADEDGILQVSGSTEDGNVGLFAQSECGGIDIVCAPPGEVAGEATDLAIPLGAGDEVFVFIEGPAPITLDTALSVDATFTPSGG